ncbi:hypothetical protein F5Y06DRAFT_262420 [Hypoxylon sp. FL0890]|nr:hypothetical protein F5Y06DRAFT_262420 [Hypoxylon sp. FL0890]
MAEIANSDSPDPLSSTPSRFPDTSTTSLPSTVSDSDSSIPESRPSDRTRLRRREHQTSHYNRPAFTVARPPMSSGNRSDTADLFEQYLPSSSPAPGERGHYFDDWDAEIDLNNPSSSEDESLFVNNRHGYDGDLDLLPPRGLEINDSDEDYFEENRLFGNLPRGIMNQAGDIEDELVEMEFEAIEVDRPRSPLGRQRSHRRHQPRAEPEVIDLTVDSPPRPAAEHQSRNIRRRRSQQRNTPPRLARSDAGYMDSHTVINLISDSDEDEDPAVLPPPRRNNPPRRINNFEPPRDQHRPPQYRPRLPQPDEGFLGGNAIHRLQTLIHNIPLFRLVNHPPALGENREEDDIAIIGQRNIIMPPPDLPPVDFNYLAHPFANPPQAAGGPNPKPAHDPPRETREGFTRNTGEDVVAICPSCEQELAYDPDDDDANSGPPPAKKARTKKDKAEHHFWAVKACGHVYCRKCYENRKPVGKNPFPVGFRPDPNGAKNKMLCAVEDCESDVSAKSSWVGIFM